MVALRAAVANRPRTASKNQRPGDADQPEPSRGGLFRPPTRKDPDQMAELTIAEARGVALVTGAGRGISGQAWDVAGSEIPA